MLDRLLRSLGLRHTRRVADPALGPLVEVPGTDRWIGHVTPGGRAIDLLLAGAPRPDPALAARARALVADFDALEERVTAYLARQAREEAWRARGLDAEVGALRIAQLALTTPGRPDDARLDFLGPDATRSWSCRLTGDEPRDLDVGR